MPKYDGDDDLETFMKWLQGFISFLDVHRLVGPDNDHLRVTATQATLTGPAETWFDMSIKPGVLTSHWQYPSFLEVILRMADRFIPPAAATKAQQSFDKVTYTCEKGIQRFMSQLQMITFHIMLTVDEYMLRNRIVESIPPSMRNNLIDYKGLSTTTSTVVEWVKAIEDRELELRERAAYDEATTVTKKPPIAAAQTNNVRAKMNRPRSSSQAKPVARMSDRATPLGTRLPSKQTVPLAEITCHACGKKGHYKGSQECPHMVKPPSSARLHTMGFDQSRGEL